jgi:hypothetical protein
MPDHTAPNGYRKTRTSITFESKAHGKLTLYFEEGAVHANSYKGPYSTVPYLWKAGQFDESGLRQLARQLALNTPDTGAMVDWLKGEIIKLASMQLEAVDD